MSETVMLEIPDALAQRARSVAQHTQRRIEEVLIEWLDRAATELPMELLPDDQVLALRDMQMDEVQQAELSDLLTHQREGQLSNSEQVRLDMLMDIYRSGMMRKAQALKIAVDRGLQPPLR
jgi:hypothetical protein